MAMPCSQSTVATRVLEAVAVSDLFGRVAGLVVLQDVVDVVGAEEPFRAGWQAIVA
jgi:hypothetical protein